MKRFSIYFFLLILISLVEAKPPQEYIQFGTLQPVPMCEHELPMVFGKPSLTKKEDGWLVCCPSGPNISGVWEEIDGKDEAASNKLLVCGRSVWKNYPAIATELAQQSLELKDTPAAWSLLGVAAKGKLSQELSRWIEARESVDAYRCLAILSNGKESERWREFSRDPFKALTGRAVSSSESGGKLGKERAYRDYLAAIKFKAKKKGDLQFPMGELQLALGNWDKALLHFTAAAELGNQDALVYKGDCLRNLEGWDNLVSAMLAYKKATGPLAQQRVEELREKALRIKHKVQKIDEESGEITIDTAEMEKQEGSFFRLFEGLFGEAGLFLGSVARESYNAGSYRQGVQFALDWFEQNPTEESLKLVMTFYTQCDEIRGSVLQRLSGMKSKVAKIEGSVGELCLAKMYYDKGDKEGERACFRRAIEAGSAPEEMWETYFGGHGSELSLDKEGKAWDKLAAFADKQDNVWGYEAMLRFALLQGDAERLVIWLNKAKAHGSVLAQCCEVHELLGLLVLKKKEEESTVRLEKDLQEKMFSLMRHVVSADQRIALYVRLNLSNSFGFQGLEEKSLEFLMRSHYLPLPNSSRIWMPIPRREKFDERMLRVFKGDFGYKGVQLLQAHMRAEAKAYLATIVEKSKQGIALTKAEYQILQAARQVIVKEEEEEEMSMPALEDGGEILPTDDLEYSNIITQAELEKAKLEQREQKERLLQKQRLEAAQEVVDFCIADIITQAELEQREQEERQRREEEKKETASGFSPWGGEGTNRSWADMMEEFEREQSK
ncbi:hypothetical protein HOM50_03770 [bacterium]|jgi:hypothetical protein|nr:hypothetical protein [bacterium]MBT5015496.1 hypothetical protein [bacterium]